AEAVRRRPRHLRQHVRRMSFRRRPRLRHRQGRRGLALCHRAAGCPGPHPAVGEGRFARPDAAGRLGPVRRRARLRHDFRTPELGKQRATGAAGYGEGMARRLCPPQGSLDGRGTPAIGQSHTGPVLTVTGLRKRYGSMVALDGIDFSVDAGEVLGLLGPNGAGKTTAVECIAGLLRPDGGEIVLDGAVIDRSTRGRIGIAPQGPSLPDAITPGEAMSLFARLYHVRADTDRL